MFHQKENSINFEELFFYKSWKANFLKMWFIYDNLFNIYGNYFLNFVWSESFWKYLSLIILIYKNIDECIKLNDFQILNIKYVISRSYLS
jgi:hypothetical protein